MHPSGEWFTFWESQLLRGDPSIEYIFVKRSEYRVFEPFDVCQTNFPTDRLRLELDTRTVVDWNELDYVKLTGSASLPAGALLPDEQLTYVPDPDQSGQDSFEYTMSDCAFNPKRQPAATVIEINIVPVNDAPVASQLEMTTSSDLERYRLPGADGISIDLSKLVTDVDDEAHIFAIASLLGKVTARIDGSSLLISWPAEQDTGNFGFEILFDATDSGGLAAQGLVLYTPSCRPGQYVVAGDDAQNGKDSTDFRRCEDCPAGSTAPDVGRTACTECAAGLLSFRCEVWVSVCDTLLFVQATFNPIQARCSASNAIALAITTRSSAGRVFATCALQGLEGIHSARLARSALSLNACAGSGQHMWQVPRVHVCRKQDCVPVQGRCVRDRVPTSNLSISCMGLSHAGYRASKGFYKNYKKQGVGEQVTHTHSTILL